MGAPVRTHSPFSRSRVQPPRNVHAHMNIIEARCAIEFQVAPLAMVAIRRTSETRD